MASVCSLLVISAANERTFVLYNLLSSSAALVPSAAFLFTKITLAPADANPAAIANPNPFDPPVMMADLPLKSNSLMPGSFSIVGELIDYWCDDLCESVTSP
jgi:hypothetical protein